MKDLICWLLIHQLIDKKHHAAHCQFASLGSKSSLTLDAIFYFSQHFFLSRLRNFEYLGTQRVKIRRKGKEKGIDRKKKKGQTNTKHPEETPEWPFLMFLILPFFPLSLQVLLLTVTFIKYFHHGNTVYR